MKVHNSNVCIAVNLTVVLQYRHRYSLTAIALLHTINLLV